MTRIEYMRQYIEQAGIEPGTPCVMRDKEGRMEAGLFSDLTEAPISGGNDVISLHFNYGEITGQGGVTWRLEDIQDFFAFPEHTRELTTLFASMERGQQEVEQFFRHYFVLFDYLRPVGLHISLTVPMTRSLLLEA